MINLIKKKLLDDPIHIVNILDEFGFSDILYKSNRITCALDYTHDNKKAISIKLIDNEQLFVKDFVRNINKDIINFIMVSKNQDFKTVINALKKEVCIEGNYEFNKKTNVFGGFYNNIRKRNSVYEQKTYDKDILNNYISIVTKEFLKDGISVKTHKDLNIMYDVETQRVVFPIYDWIGNIIGIKGRANWYIGEDDVKYLYLVPCSISNTLYGFWQNYTYIQNSIVLIAESEKAFFQCYTYGFRNIVSLGCGSITPQQCKLVMSLNPSRVIFINDEGYDIEMIEKNVSSMEAYNRFKNIPIEYWDYSNSKYIKKGSKCCITDKGKNIFFKILKEELKVDYEELLETENTIN